MSNRLADLFPSHRELFGDRMATSLAYDSRRVVPGSVFFAITGTAQDGHSFIPDAVSQGATVIVGEYKDAILPPNVQYISVPNARIALAKAAAIWYNEPAKKLKILGFTGSNGKTTSTYIAQSILAAAGYKCSVFGTIGYIIGGKHRNAVHTTPESLELQGLLADAVAAGDQFVAMEVSSHALALHRVYGIEFAGAVWTNLTQDHLDFHETMEKYFQAKAMMFLTDAISRIRLVNKDDPYAARLLADKGVESFGIDQLDADYRASNIRYNDMGLEFSVTGLTGGPVKFRAQFFGKYNVQNILGVAALMDRIGVPTEAIVEGVVNLRGVAGRLQRIPSNPAVKAFIDYAHTPDAMEKVIRTAREFTPGRLHVVFGCGGNRDRAKRPLMGAAATSADVITVTSDNPRFEEPMDIIHDILPGLESAQANTRIEADRTLAIANACRELSDGDVLLVLGKGAEEYVEIKGIRYSYSDYQEVLQSLENAGWKQ